MTTLQQRADTDELAIETTFDLLDDTDPESREAVLKTLWTHASEAPLRLRSYSLS